MPETPVHFRLPPRCPHCGAMGTVALETSVNGNVVRLLWWCRGCSESWSVKRQDVPVLEMPSTTKTLMPN